MALEPLTNSALASLIGAGTTGHVATLQANGTVAWAEAAGADASGMAGAVQFSDGASGFNSDATNLFWDDANNRLSLPEIRAAGAAGLKLYDDGGNGIFVKDGGNVGVGTTSPGAKLDVTGIIIASDKIGISNTSPTAKLQIGTNAGANGGDFYSFNSGGNPRFLFGDAATVGNYGGVRWDSTLDAIQLFTERAGTSQLVLRDSGNVGISTPNPFARLHIQTTSAEEGLMVQGAASQSAVLAQLRGTSSTGSSREHLDIDADFSDSTDATRKSIAYLRVWDTAAREAMRMEADGSAARLGFFGVSAVTRPQVTASGVSASDLLTALNSLGLLESI